MGRHALAQIAKPRPDLMGESAHSSTGMGAGLYETLFLARVQRLQRMALELAVTVLMALVIDLHVHTIVGHVDLNLHGIT
jgi:hypothetical protein